jgi:rare lipoprotein A
LRLFLLFAFTFSFGQTLQAFPLTGEEQILANQIEASIHESENNSAAQWEAVLRDTQDTLPIENTSSPSFGDLLGGLLNSPFIPPKKAEAGDTFERCRKISGMASYYGSELQGRRTASGEPFAPGGLTAAHRTFPLGTHVRVTYLKTGRSVIVRINDRGPHVRGRIIDISYGAARAIGMLETSAVTIEACL